MTRATAASAVEMLSGLDPVLFDVGASAGPPEIWASIAHLSTYVGFDPDARAMQEDASEGFSRNIIVPKAVAAKTAPDVQFFLTTSPYCSSTLLPDLDSLSNYLFADLFEVQGEVTVPAITLEEAVMQTGVSSIDWLKLDTQGTDLRIFTSLPEPLRQRVIALDIEPGLIDAYEGEDLFIDAHRVLTNDGFWLSRLDVHGAVRMSTSTRKQLASREISQGLIERAVRISPGWVGARYLRNLEAVERLGTREAILSWTFAMIDEQPGFALDVGRLLPDSLAQRANDMAINVINGSRRSWQLSRMKRQVMRAAGKVRSLVR